MDTADLDADPHVQFDIWFAEATAANLPSPERMALATAAVDAVPSVRMVLLKAHDARGFVFYTNRASRKARELEQNPRAAATLHWEELHRQVRVEGPVEQLGDAESHAYFVTRARSSQVSAWASPQSEVVASRAELETRVGDIERRFAGEEELPLPPFWGGYRIAATSIEFWQGQANRLHDRVRYERTSGGGWERARLAP